VSLCAELWRHHELTRAVMASRPLNSRNLNSCAVPFAIPSLEAFARRWYQLLGLSAWGDTADPSFAIG
jgi:hypothetical protein